jgi:hypothetical protein
VSQWRRSGGAQRRRAALDRREELKRRCWSWLEETRGESRAGYVGRDAMQRLGLRENLEGMQEPTQGRKLGPATGEQVVQDAFKWAWRYRAGLQLERE